MQKGEFWVMPSLGKYKVLDLCKCKELVTALLLKP
jgi:hypothetical protein